MQGVRRAQQPQGISLNEPFDVEYEGRPCGRGCIAEVAGGWAWAWEMCDATMVVGPVFVSAEEAGDGLMRFVVAWYEAMQ